MHISVDHHWNLIELEQLLMCISMCHIQFGMVFLI